MLGQTAKQLRGHYVYKQGCRPYVAPSFDLLSIQPSNWSYQLSLTRSSQLSLLQASITTVSQAQFSLDRTCGEPLGRCPSGLGLTTQSSRSPCNGSDPQPILFPLHYRHDNSTLLDIIQHYSTLLDITTIILYFFTLPNYTSLWWQVVIKELFIVTWLEASFMLSHTAYSDITDISDMTDNSERDTLSSTLHPCSCTWPYSIMSVSWHRHPLSFPIHYWSCGTCTLTHDCHSLGFSIH